MLGLQLSDRGQHALHICRAHRAEPAQRLHIPLGPVQACAWSVTVAILRAPPSHMASLRALLRPISGAWTEMD